MSVGHKRCLVEGNFSASLSVKATSTQLTRSSSTPSHLFRRDRSVLVDKVTSWCMPVKIIYGFHKLYNILYYIVGQQSDDGCNYGALLSLELIEMSVLIMGLAQMFTGSFKLTISNLRHE